MEPQVTSPVTWGGGYSTKIVSEGQLDTNPWNPNKQTEDVYQKVKESLRLYGFVDLPQVRQLEGGRYQIINGEHRVRAARELGIVDIPVIDLGVVPDQVAKKLTIITNELGGTPDPTLLSKLVRDLNSGETMADLARELPFAQNELESLSKLTEQFDWDALAADLPVAGDAPPTKPVRTGGERKFQIGTVKGNIPTALAAELTDEYNRTAVALNAGPERVFLDWIARLKATSPGAS